MRDDKSAGPPLLLARQETAHREHLHLHLHQNQHNRLHNRQPASGTVVTEVVATVSVVQQVEVDPHGSTVATQLVTAYSTDSTPTTDTASPTAIVAASPLITASSARSPSLLSGQSVVSVPTSIRSDPASLIISSNSTCELSRRASYQNRS